MTTPATPHARPGGPAAGGGQYLTFALGEEVFAMNIGHVREIIQYGPMTRCR
jgi:chemotaxis signal transduction protein